MSMFTDPPIVDKDARYPSVVAMPGFVTLDGGCELGRDRHSARLLALGARIPVHAQLQSPAVQRVQHQVGQTVRAPDRQAAELGSRVSDSSAVTFSCLAASLRDWRPKALEVVVRTLARQEHMGEDGVEVQQDPRRVGIAVNGERP